MSVSGQVITVRSTHAGHCSALVRNLETSVKPTISTEPANRGFGIDRTKTALGAGSQRSTAQLEVKIATSKLSMTLMASQIWLPPMNGASRVVQFVQQFVNTQKQYMSSQGPNIVKCKR